MTQFDYGYLLGSLATGIIALVAYIIIILDKNEDE